MIEKKQNKAKKCNERKRGQMEVPILHYKLMQDVLGKTRNPPKQGKGEKAETEI